MENMGEVDTKPIDSVQAAISLFCARSDQKKQKQSSSNGCEKERELEEVVKDLANYKVQLEAKDAAYMQALLKLEQQQKVIDELSELLKTAELDRNKYINECGEAIVQLNELEGKFNEMTDQCSENVKVREQLFVGLSKLKIRQSELNGILPRELLQNTGLLEKEKTVDLVRYLLELSETLLTSKLAAIEAGKEMSAVLSEKDVELEVAAEKFVEVQKQLEKVGKQMETIRDLESRLLAKTLYADMLELSLKQTDEPQRSYEKASSDDLSDFKQLKADFEVKDWESSDQALFNGSLEMELNRLNAELKNANEEIGKFKGEIDTLTEQLAKMKLEMDEIKESESDARVLITLLKSELHKGRSKMAEAEAGIEEPQFDDSKTEASEGRDEVATITITLKEYQSLIKNVDQTSVRSEEDSCSQTKSDSADELEKLKQELEAAVTRIGEFKTRAEQAITRADMAEKAKEAIEEQLRKWREQKQKRKSARDAMKEASGSKQFNPPMYNRNSGVYQPLGKVLNMKF